MIIPAGWLLWETNLSERYFQGNSTDTRTDAKQIIIKTFSIEIYTLFAVGFICEAFIYFVETEAP